MNRSPCSPLWVWGCRVFVRGNLPRYEIFGLGGIELGRFWEKHRYQAYEGTTVPSFPNYFLALGPYSANRASWFSMVEAQVAHALRCIREAHCRRATFAEVEREAHDAYFRKILRRQRNTVSFNANCVGANSYYFDRNGDAPFLRPSSGLEMWWRSRHFDLDHYRFLPRPEARSVRRELDLRLCESGQAYVQRAESSCAPSPARDDRLRSPTDS